MKKIMLVMVLSSLGAEQRCKGGVDSVCQMLLKGIVQVDIKNEYLVIAFNPGDDTKNNGKLIQLSRNIKIKMYDMHLNCQSKIKRLIPNFVWHNLIIKKEVTDFCPHILHVHNPSWLLSNYKKIKKIITLHSYKKIGRSSFGFLNDFIYEKIIQPINIKNATVVTTVSEDIRKILIKKGCQKVKLVLNPVNDVFLRINRKERPADKNVSIIIPGNIGAIKRSIDGLKVITELRREYPNIKLIFAGRFSKKSRYYLMLQEYINEHRLRENVKFVGELCMDELLHYYSNVTFGLFLSENETFGLAPLEMMAAGIPVISTNVGVLRWYEADFKKRGAFLVKPGESLPIITILKYLIQRTTNVENEELKKFIMECFSIRKIAKEYLSLY